MVAIPMYSASQVLFAPDMVVRFLLDLKALFEEKH